MSDLTEADIRRIFREELEAHEFRKVLNGLVSDGLITNKQREAALEKGTMAQNDIPIHGHRDWGKSSQR